MKHLINITFGILAITSLIGCKKDQPLDSPTPTPSGYFFKNTEWAGTFHALSQQYDAPCAMHFWGDTALTVYGLFTYVDDLSTLSHYGLDSITGRVTNVDTTTYEGTMVVDVTFPFTGQQDQLRLTNKTDMTSLSYGTSLPYNYFSYNLGVCPANIPAISGTWSGAYQEGTGTQNPQYDYPDLSSVIFGDGNVVFTRNGLYCHYTPPNNDVVVSEPYHQKGSRVYFYGFNETNGVAYPYFGIYTGGNVMLVDAWHVGPASDPSLGPPRLPNHLDTSWSNGQPGVTPYITKQ